MTTSARERSGFGQFQLNRSHIGVGVDYSKVHQRGSAGDMAEMLRDGAKVAEVCEAFGVSTSTIRTRLSDAGWSCQTGQPLNTFSEPQVRSPQASFLFIDQPWADQAVCAQTDPEAFFPEKGGTTREAKSVCARCFVQAECLDWALTTNEQFGVWGGLSERERHAIRNGTVTTCPDCGDIFYNQGGYITHQRSHRTTNTEGTAS